MTQSVRETIFHCTIRRKHIKLVLLAVVVILVFKTCQINIDFVKSFQNKLMDRVQVSRTLNIVDITFQDTKHQLNVSKGVYVKAGTRTDVADSLQKPARVDIAKGVHVDVAGPMRNLKRPLTTGHDVFAIKSENICGPRENITFVVVVHTSTDHFDRRISIRQTWGNNSLFPLFNMRLAFILGKPTNKTLQRLIQQENKVYNDIVQGNFIDTYQNLTNKAVLGLRWVTEYCSSAKFVIKVDDDVFFNPFGLFRDVVTTYSKISRTIFCNVRLKGTDTILHAGKWSVGKEFTDMTFWPVTFCPGFFVLYTRDVVPELYKVAKSGTAPYVWLDDVYVIGFLAEKARNITHAHFTLLRPHVAFVGKSQQMYTHWKRVLAQNEKEKADSKLKGNN